MLTLLKLDLSKYVKKHVFGLFNLSNSEIFRLTIDDMFLETLATYTKKMSLPSAVLGGVGCTVRSAGSSPNSEPVDMEQCLTRI